MTKQPKVSILMNCYNGERYLREAIDSVVGQTYQNWELVFWDNQSTDSSAEIFKSYADSRLNYFYAPAHTLLYEARNYAFAKAQGEFIAFLDVDDWWESDKLERQIPLFDEEEVGLVYGNFWLVDERKARNRRVMHSEVLPDGRVLNQLLRKNMIGLLTLVVRRKAVVCLEKIFDSRYQIIGDFDLIVRLAAEWKLACVQSPVASYRWHGNNLSILETGREVGELEIWCNEIQRHPIIATQPGLTTLHNYIVYAKVMRAISQGHRAKAFALFLQYPLNVNKLKLLFALVMPLSLVKVLRTD